MEKTAMIETIIGVALMIGVFAIGLARARMAARK